MKKILFISTLLLASCQNDFDFEKYYSDEYHYNKNFTNAIGNIDSKQNWNMFVENHITVPYESDWSIYNASDGHLLASYCDISGELAYSATYDVDSVIVCDNKRGWVVPYDGSVNATRASEVINGITINKHSDYWLDLTPQDIKSWADALPEGSDNSGNVTQNFEFISNGNDIVIYLLYWNAGNNNEIGIYTYNNDGTITTTPLDIKTKADNTHLYADGNLIKSTANTFYPDNYTSFKSQGVSVNIAEGSRWGLYVHCGTNTYYSSVVHNTKCNFAHGAVWEFSDEYDYVSFEDLCNGKKRRTHLGTDSDFNDIVLLINKQRKIVSDPSSFMIAYEDLGSTDDFDFNDIVLKVTYSTTTVNRTVTTDMDVTLCAAGGTYACRVLYDGDTIAWNGINEVHQAFGVNSYEMVNTSLNGRKYNTSVVDNLKRKEAITTHINLNYGFSTATDAQKFTICVSSNAKPINIVGTEGRAPQGIVIANSEWLWPNERINIYDEYPSFKQWCQNHTFVNWTDIYE